MKRKGLTLIEPIIVLLVVGILVGVMLMVLPGRRERAHHARCPSSLKQIVLGCHLYSSDFAGAFPKSLGELYPEYISDGGVFACPRARNATKLEDDPRFSAKNYTPAMFGDTHTDYVYVSGLTANDPASYVLAFDDEWNHDGAGVNVVFIGSNVEWKTDFKWLHEQLADQAKELATQGRTMTIQRPAWSRYPELPPPPRPWFLTPGGAVASICGLLLAALVGFGIIRSIVMRARGQWPPDARDGTASATENTGSV